MRKVARCAPAKVNLWLRVVGRRADGYHELDSLVAFAALADQVAIEAAAHDRLSIDGEFAAGLSDGDDNLVRRAARLLGTRMGRASPVDIRLTKNIPVAAGLGGGSSDAAATLLALQDLWRLEPGAADLAAMAAELGADVPMCLSSRAALVGGVGEQVRSYVALPACAILLANPRIPLPTADVFRSFARSPRGSYSAPSPLVRSFDALSSLAVAIAEGGNDLLDPACALVPAIAAVLAELRSHEGLCVAGMSGSGATCFALAADVEAAAAAAALVARRHPDWWVWSGEILRG